MLFIVVSPAGHMLLSFENPLIDVRYTDTESRCLLSTMCTVHRDVSTEETCLSRSSEAFSSECLYIISEIFSRPKK